MVHRTFVGEDHPDGGTLRTRSVGHDSRPNTSAKTRTRRRGLAVVALLASTWSLSACGPDDPVLSDSPDAVTATSGPDSAPTSTSLSSTSPSSTSPSSTITPANPPIEEPGAPVADPAVPVGSAAAPVFALPTPVAPPVDDEADEPVVELGSIEIPALGVTEPLLEGIRLPTFDRGVGHWPGTAMPGAFGNAVLGGHRTEGRRPFRNLDTLVAGDEVILTTADGRFVYVVVSIEIISPDDLGVVAQNPGFTATLFACHPPGSIDERLVAHLSLQS